MSDAENGMSADVSRVAPSEPTGIAAELGNVSRDSGVVIGRDALGNVIVTGDSNTVEVKLTVVVADARLQASASHASRLQNPYRGLDAFRETDSALFFGRGDLVRKLWTTFHALQRGHAPRVLPILGPSGSGKSSLVRAGLLPELVRQPMEGMRRPTVLVLRPGADPAQRLIDALARFTPARGTAPLTKLKPMPSPDLVHRAAQGAGDADHRVLIFVDQLEELFTECTSEAARKAFLATLAYAAAQPDRRVSVVFAMRNDFAGALRTHETFAVAVREQPLRVSLMSKKQLVEAIEAPAQVLGHPWPFGLVDTLVLQCEGRVGALPLLQFALKRLWSEHVAGRLAQSERSSQLIEDFLTDVADALYERSGKPRERKDHQGIIRRAFVAMVQLGEGAADTRRAARLSELVALRETPDEVRAVLAPFAAPEARLITVSEVDGEPTYELTHEVLIGSWARLTTWLGNVPDKDQAEAIRSRLRLRRRLAYVASSRHNDRDALWRPPELELAIKLRDQHPEELTAFEHSFVEESRVAWEAHGRWRRRANALAVGATIVFVGVVSVLGLVTWRQSGEAQRQARAAQENSIKAQENSAEAQRQTREVHRRLADSYQEQGRALLIDLSPPRPMRALPYLLAAREERQSAGDDVGPTLRMLFAQAAAAAPLVLFSHRGEVRAAAFSPDGARVVTASWDKTARVWDARTGKPVTEPLAHQARVAVAAFSPDGTRVVTASFDRTARIWDARTGKPVTEPLSHQDRVVAAAFSPDGTLVVTASFDKTARVWDARTGKPVSESLAHQDKVVAAAFSPDGARVVTASDDQTARLWDVRTGKPVTKPLAHRGPVSTAAFSPDGTRVVTASDDQTARVWDAHTGKPVTKPLAHQGYVAAVAFSPDGTRVVTASDDQTARVWDAHTGKPVTKPLAHQGYVAAAAFSPDGTRVVTASGDQTARVWDALTGQPVTEPLAHQASVVAAAFSPDSTRVVTASDDQTARLWDARTSKPVAKPLVHQGWVAAAVFSPDGARVVTASWDKTARVWDVRTGKPVTEPLEHQAQVVAAVFSPDGARVVTASWDKTAQVWDARTGKPLTEAFAHQSPVVAAAFSPDGARIITASFDKTARVWDARTGKPLTESFAHQDSVVAAAFSPDGARVVTASGDKTARVWDARTGKPLTESFAHQDSVVAAAFSPDGARVVTASWDKTARVWDARTGKPVTASLAHQYWVRAAAFSPDSACVVTASDDKTARVWDARTGKPVTEPLAHQDRVVAAAFSPDGARVVTASQDHTARVWDARTGKPVTEPLTHQGQVVAAAFSPDGVRVVTASKDNTARIWELPLAPGSLDDWNRRARCGVYAIDGGVLVDNHAPCP